MDSMDDDDGGGYDDGTPEGVGPDEWEATIAAERAKWEAEHEQERRELQLQSASLNIQRRALRHQLSAADLSTRAESVSPVSRARSVTSRRSRSKSKVGPVLHSACVCTRV